ncbi:plasmid recombination protein, partial [Bacteroides caecimuris]|uniref:plasmid recombination protein n=2 Tax=Bacteroidales TaxID=171549 RepID=UPI00257263E7
SAVLHMDEQTPHIHATLVPIVKGERKRKKKEEQVKKRYRKKPTDTARLCADEIMTRAKLKSYQDTYAQAMSGYGLQRGIDGSEAKHITTRQYYRDLVQQTEQLRTDIGQLRDRKETAQEELRRAKKKVQTEKLKGAATTAATNIAESVGSFFGSNKVKTLERENSALHQVVAIHEGTIETLQTKLHTIQADHSRQLLDMQQKHIKELQVRDTEHKKEVSRLTVLLNKTLKWFPQIKGMLNLERLCLAVGFSQEQTAILMMGKSLEYSGELYSEEHKRKFMAKEVKAKVFSDKGKFVLTIDLKPIGDWFKEQFEKLRQGVNIRQSPKQSRLKL